MKKFLISSTFLIMCTILLTGCIERTELSNIAIVAGLGIDKIDDRYELTVQILNPASITGENQNALPVYSIKETGETIYEAYQKLDQITTSQLFLSHLNVIVINTELAESGIGPVLNFALRHTDIRPDINIVISKNASANEILNVLTSIDTIPAAQLDIFTNRSASSTARLTNYNLYEVVDMVNSDSINVVLNSVSIHHENNEQNTEGKLNRNLDSTNSNEFSTSTQNDTNNDENFDHQENNNSDDFKGSEQDPSNNENSDASNNNEETNSKNNQKIEGATIDNILEITSPVQLRIDHLAVFNGDELVGFLDEDEAQFYNVLLGISKRYALKARIDEEYYVAAEVTDVSSKIETNIEKNKATINIEITAMIVENTYPIDLTTQDNLDIMSEHLQKQFENDIDSLINRIQTEFKTDVLGIGGRAYYDEHKLWTQKEGYWSEIFPDIDIKINIDFKIDSVGEIGNVVL